MMSPAVESTSPPYEVRNNRPAVSSLKAPLCGLAFDGFYEEPCGYHQQHIKTLCSTRTHAANRGETPSAHPEPS